jgi:hypothetical protein
MKAIYSKNNIKSFCQQVETNIFVSTIIRGEESTITKSYSVPAITLRYILSLSHNTLCCEETFLLLQVIALGVKKPLLTLIVLALVTFQLLSLLKVIALTDRQKR